MLQKLVFITTLLYSLSFLSSQQLVHSSSDVNLLKYEEKLFETVDKISHHLEKFNLHYLTKLEDKFLNIMQTMNTIDMNVKLLQEKAQVWEIFRHHIDSWSDHMKSVDQKIEILKRSHDRLPLMENQLQSMDFKVQHVFDKVDLLNEKFHDFSKNLLSSQQKPPARPSTRNPAATKTFSAEGQEEFEQTEILMRLHSIQRMLLQNQRQNPPVYVGKFSKNNIDGVKAQRMSSVEPTSPEVTELKGLLVKINANIDKIPIRDIKQSFNLDRKQDKALQTITEIVNHIDERTTRIFDTNSYQFRKLLTCCKNTENEIFTFTGNADTLLKRTEKVMLNVGKCNGLTGSNRTVSSRDVESDSDGDIHIETDGGESGSASGEDNENENNSEDADDMSIFQQPKKSHCYQLSTDGRNGVYVFGFEREFNAGDRDFLQQYCEFATDGPAWTVIQRRDGFAQQENFNRSWNDYKHGFGNLSKDFWFGNDYIHKLTYEDNMVLRIEMEDFEGNKMWVEYGVFRVESEKFKYNLIVDEYRGSVPDSFLYHNDMDFSTFDRNNDKVNTTCCPCALSLGSGWWFGNCAESNLNGNYKRNPKGNNFTGIFWEHWLGDYSLKSTKMLIRPKDIWFTSVSDEDFIQLPKNATEDP